MKNFKMKIEGKLKENIKKKKFREYKRKSWNSKNNISDNI